MTVTEVTTSIAIVGGVTLIGLLLLPQRVGRRSVQRFHGRFTVSTVPLFDQPSASPREGSRRSGKVGSRFVALTLLAVVSGLAVGVTASLLLVLARGTIGLGAG